ncbi:unnamed protein product [Caenorhabditis nigoni]
MSSEASEATRKPEDSQIAIVIKGNPAEAQILRIKGTKPVSAQPSINKNSSSPAVPKGPKDSCRQQDNAHDKQRMRDDCD